MRRYLIALTLVLLFVNTNIVSAATWVKVVNDPAGNIYVDTESLREISENVIKVATKVTEPNGYSIVLERYALDYNSMQMDAILSFSYDNSLIEWSIIDNKNTIFSRLFGESFQEINPGCDGFIINEFIKDRHRKGLIPMGI